jgi:hypothetical protein
MRFSLALIGELPAKGKQFRQKARLWRFDFTARVG